MNIEDIYVGMEIMAIDEDYKGLKGWIFDIKKGEDKETENETILDIYVEFEEPSDLKQTHPHLWDTWSAYEPILDYVIMGEDELAFYEKTTDELPKLLNGQYVCTNCSNVLENVVETQYDDITWSFEDGRYIKYDGAGGSEGKRCPSCDVHIEDVNAETFPY